MCFNQVFGLTSNVNKGQTLEISRNKRIQVSSLRQLSGNCPSSVVVEIKHHGLQTLLVILVCCRPGGGKTAGLGHSNSLLTQHHSAMTV